MERVNSLWISRRPLNRNGINATRIRIIHLCDHTSGCNIGCTFCASGIIAKQRDLLLRNRSASHARATNFRRSVSWDRVSQIVVMGIGEPFDNYDNVISFLKAVNSDKGFNRARHITVSTSGLVRKFMSSQTKAYKELALSLHAQITIHRTYHAYNQ